MSIERPASPYLLPPGPERRAMMADMGIVVGLLDWTDEEWKAMQPMARTGDGAHDFNQDETDPATRLG